MPEVENDYVATATAEKRLREVLAERFAGTGPDTLDGLMSVLLAGAEITYLPRKKSVSIVLRVPATAGPTVTPKGEPVNIPTDGPSYDTEPVPSAIDPELGVPRPSDYPPTEPTAPAPRAARFGLFTPTSTDESDYFTE